MIKNFVAGARAAIADPEFRRDAATLASLVGGGLLLAVGIWGYVLGFWIVS